MTQEALAPTPERLRRSHWDTPEVDSKTNRRAYKARDVFMELLRNGKIDGAQFQAIERFRRHLEGSEGHDVRVTDYLGEPCDYRQPARTMHAIHIADARKELEPLEFMALERLCRESSTLVQVGFGLSGIANPDRARKVAVEAVQKALLKLSYFWGFKRQEPPIR